MNSVLLMKSTRYDYFTMRTVEEIVTNDNLNLTSFVFPGV